MFLDMKSSTTIAEKIGNTQYFNLISEVFGDITDPILETDGELYQYVGDDIEYENTCLRVLLKDY